MLATISGTLTITAVECQKTHTVAIVISGTTVLITQEKGHTISSTHIAKSERMKYRSKSKRLKRS